jgi:hypothetical protein
MAVNPTADAVSFAINGGETPASGDFVAGSWETDPTTSPPTYVARVLVGPAGLARGVGTWIGWCKIGDNPEIVVERVFTLIIY